MVSVAFVILLLSIVQSLFGVGLLVFGTPALLLLGYPFGTVLTLLLPASATISLLQFRDDAPSADLRPQILWYCLPGVIAGISLLLALGHGVNMRFFVGLLMLATAAARWAMPGAALRAGLRAHSQAAFTTVGFVHGFTNMGGGLLAILVSSLRAEKATIRANIAFAYLTMALSQLLVLALTRHQTPPPAALLLMLIAGLTYRIVGRQLFALTSQVLYQRMLTAFIAVFGLSLVAL
jgi:uncharacterized membrane protein YfcA